MSVVDEGRCETGAAAMTVGKADDQVAHGLELAGVLERTGIDSLESHALDERRDFLLRSLVVAGIENLWRSFARQLFQERGEDGIERLHDFRRAGLFLNF